MQQIFLKKDEKISEVISTLPANYSFEDFVDKFKELYPSEWDKINARYAKHERNTKEGKSHPMPNPLQYLKNMLNVWIKKSDK